MNISLRVIITGATGMVGEGVLHECLQSNQVAEVLIVNRKPSGFAHPKLKEVILADFFNAGSIREELKGFNACFFCLGVSSIGMSEDDYAHATYDLTLAFAGVLVALNPDMVFCYVSGSGTDSSEKGKVMWARVKGKTENDLKKLSFKKTYAFRPGYMHPTKGLENTKGYYKFLSWLYPAWKLLFPGRVSTLKELGDAMIHTAAAGYAAPVLEVRDIKRAAHNR